MQNNISKALLRKKFSKIESPVKPEWIKVKIQTDKINQIMKTLKSNRIVTVCEEAMCPNISDCWAKSHATFMILGDICTRACSFCNISTGKPNHVDHTEPLRVANSVKKLKLSHVVITSVDRDDLKDGGPDEEIQFNVELSGNDIKSQSEPEFQESSSGVDLTAAELIVSIGRGIESEDNLPTMQSLADAMGAEVASSRPVVDMGWLPPYRQVGSSGQVISPKLYFSLGVSGAIQHVVGMKGSKNILAINKDEDAPIFEIADYAVIGDVLEIVPKLTEEINK